AATAPARTSRTGRTPRQRRAARNRWLWAVPMWLLALAFLLPFAWMLSTSLKANADAFAVPMQWIPDPWRGDAAAGVFPGGGAFLAAFEYAVIGAAARALGEVLTAAMAGYAFARLHVRGRDTVFLGYLASSISPAQLLLVRRFIYFQQL